jgi:hypothetical protein
MSTTLTAAGYQLGATACAYPHLGTFATADDAHDAAEFFARIKGRTYSVHAILSDGTTRALPVAA